MNGPEEATALATATPFRQRNYGWVVVACSILSQMLVYGIALSSFSFWVSDWMGEFQTSRAFIMSSVVISYVITALIAPLVGAAVERRRFRNIIGIGMLSFTVGYALLPLARASWQIVGIYGTTMGTAMAFCGPVAAQTIAAKWFVVRRGFALGIILTGSAFGGIMMPPVIAFLLKKFEWRTVSWFIALIGAVAIPVIWLLVKNPSTAAALAASGRQDSTVPAAVDERPWTVERILSDRNFWAMVITILPTFMAFQAVSANYSLLLADVGVGAQKASLLFSFMAICTIIGKPIVGRLSDRHDHRFMVILGCLLAGTGNVLVLLGDHPGNFRLLLGAALMSATAAFFFPLQGAMISRYFGEKHFGRVIGLLNFFFVFGALGSPIAGLVRDRLGSYHFFVLGMTAMPLLTAPFIFLLKRNADRE